jgi:hypothetical protein
MVAITPEREYARFDVFPGRVRVAWLQNCVSGRAKATYPDSAESQGRTATLLGSA